MMVHSAYEEFFAIKTKLSASFVSWISYLRNRGKEKNADNEIEIENKKERKEKKRSQRRRKKSF